MSDRVKIGWSEVDITPDRKIGLAGQFFERVTDEVESPITVTAFALECGNEQLIICSCDLECVGNLLRDKVCEKLNGKLPFGTEKVILSAIHTHTSFVYEGSSDILAETYNLHLLESVLPENVKYIPLVSSSEAMPPKEATEFLAERIAKAAVEAWENRNDAYYANAFGRVAVGMNRRVVYSDGTAKMWGDTNHADFDCLESGNDSGMELIYTFDPQKKLTGVIANIACPAQVVEHRSFISSDYWGKVKENLREKYGKDLKVLGLCSAAGDLCPRDMVRWVNPETPIDDPNIERNDYIERRADPSMFDVSGLKLVGKRISNEIALIFEETELELKNEAELVNKALDLDLPVRRVSITEYEDAIEKIEAFAEKNPVVTYADSASLHIYAGIIDRYRLQHKMNTFPVHTHIVRFGDVAMTSFPFELFLDYGNRIRARSRAKQTFLIQLADGCFGYLPTERAEQGSHYSAYVSSGSAGHEGGDLLVRTILREINEMF